MCLIRQSKHDTFLGAASRAACPILPTFTPQVPPLQLLPDQAEHP